MITTVVFDFFDVIRKDPSKVWFKKHGIERTGKYSELFHKLDVGEIEQEQFFKRLSKLSGIDEKNIIEHYANTQVVDDNLLVLIEGIKRKYKVGLLSNSPSKYLRDILTKHDHNKLFDEVVISSEVKLVKPSPKAFNHILEKLHSEPDKAVFIDDNIHNVEAAKKLGIQGIHFRNLPQLKKDLLNLGIE